MFWAKPNGPWTGKWKDAGGTWRNKKVPVDILDEAEAERWFQAWQAEQFSAPAVPAPRLTVLQVAELWVSWLKETSTSEGYADGERCIRLWLKPFALANVAADDLELHHCVTWMEDLHRKVKTRNTCRNIIAQVRSMLSDARGKGWRDGENFFADPYVKRRFRQLYASTEKAVIVHLSRDDVGRMLHHDGRVIHQRRHTRNVFGALTGLRAAEIQGLRWSDITLATPVPNVVVDRQYVARRSTSQVPFFKPPKKGSHRTVPLHPALVPLLRQWFEKGWNEWVGRQPSPADAVFPADTGCFCNDIRPVELRLDLPAYGISPLFEGEHPVTFHALRRTFLTMLTDASVNDNDVRALAGHAAAGVTRKHYVGANLARLYEGVSRLQFTHPDKEAASLGSRGASGILVGDQDQ